MRGREAEIPPRSVKQRFAWARSPGPGIVTAAALGLTLALGATDYFARGEMGLSLVYVLPVSAVSWLVGLRSAAGVACASVLVWLLVEVAQGEGGRPLLAAFNTTRRLALLLLAAYLLTRIRSRLAEEERSARTDFLTGIGNARSFYADAGAEIDRASRYGHSFTLVCLDVDDFKAINDDLGHPRGDEVLRRIAETLRDSLRSVDRVARLGGDEFGVLLPETGYEAARIALEKLRNALRTTLAFEDRTVTVTMGAVVCPSPPGDATHAIALADAQLLAGKRTGKDSARISVHKASLAQT